MPTGIELISADIQAEIQADVQADVHENVTEDTTENATEDTTENTAKTYCHKIYIQDGHGSVTALVENSKITDTYTYDSYGILLKKTELCINTKDIFQRILMDLNRKWRYKWIKQD